MHRSSMVNPEYQYQKLHHSWNKERLKKQFKHNHILLQNYTQKSNKKILAELAEISQIQKWTK